MLKHASTRRPPARAARESRQGVQLTVRNVPERVARALQGRARREGKSVNRVLVEALTREAGCGDEDVRWHDLDWIAGTWKRDRGFDAAIAAQDVIDEDMWR
jgi:plasmid stability protein